MSPWIMFALTVVLWGMLPRAMRPRSGPPSEISGWMRLAWWLNLAYCKAWHRLEADRRAPLPEVGPAILVANHTCGIDHMLLQAISDRKLGFLVAQEYYEWPVVRFFCDRIGCIPVRRDGRDLAATRAALRHLAQGRVVPIFPEGKITPRSGREIGPAKPGAAYIALRSGVPVIPAYIRGTPETDSIAAALLTPSHARIVFGPPIDLSDLPRSGPEERAALHEATDRIMAALHALKDREMPPGPAPGRRSAA